MSYNLNPLPYDYAALEPFYDKATLQIHYEQHHAGYVKKLNAALAEHASPFEISVEELLADLSPVPEKIRTAVINFGGGHANHTLFWRIMGKPTAVGPSGLLEKSITDTFENFDAFKEMFKAHAEKVFGSGWTWLVVNQKGALEIINTLNQDSPLIQGLKPLLVLDLWEYAYYLKFQNRRSEWVDAWWNIVNWEEVGRLYNRISSNSDYKTIYAL